MGVRTSSSRLVQAYSEIIRGEQGYFVSDSGVIRTPSGRTTSGYLGTGREYKSVTIKKHEYRVHRLVAAVFLTGDSEQTLVNHKNGDKLDNDKNNLEWVTPLGNNMHAIEMGLVAAKPGRSVNQINLDGTLKHTFSTLWSAAKAVDKPPNNITACCKGRQKTAYGYKWEYAEE